MFEKTDTKPIDSNEDISVGKKRVYIFLHCFHVHCFHPPSYRFPFPALLLSFCSWTHQRTFKSRSDHKLFLFKNISRLPRLSKDVILSFLTQADRCFLRLQSLIALDRYHAGSHVPQGFCLSSPSLHFLICHR